MTLRPLLLAPLLAICAAPCGTPATAQQARASAPNGFTLTFVDADVKRVADAVLGFANLVRSAIGAPSFGGIAENAINPLLAQFVGLFNINQALLGVNDLIATLGRSGFTSFSWQYDAPAGRLRMTLLNPRADRLARLSITSLLARPRTLHPSIFETTTGFEIDTALLGEDVALHAELLPAVLPDPETGAPGLPPGVTVILGVDDLAMRIDDIVEQATFVPGDDVEINPQPLPPRLADIFAAGALLPGEAVALNPQPLPPKIVDLLQGTVELPGGAVELNPQPLPPKPELGNDLGLETKVRLQPKFQGGPSFQGQPKFQAQPKIHF